MNKKINIIPLGGLEEIGKNFTALEYVEGEHKEIYVIDVGLKFPEEDNMGINIIIPDFTYLKERREDLKKVFITHAHEDHIGAISYFMDEFYNIPVYATALSGEIIQRKIKNKSNLKNIKIISENDVVQNGKTKFTFFATNHSIPDSVGVVFHTPLGNIVHTGDYKMDFESIGKGMNFERIKELGKEGVLLLLSDSTNSEKEGYSLSEKQVKDNIEKIFEQSKGRIIVGTFGSSLRRVEGLTVLARKYQRKIYLVGRSMQENVKSAIKTKKILLTNEDLIDERELKTMEDDKILIITTGAQGEFSSGLSRISRDEHTKVKLNNKDTVILSSSPIPGNEKMIGKMIDDLLKKEVHVIYGKNVHTSGHGYQEEQKIMIKTLSPRYFMPIHGEYRMLHQHSQTAQKLGIRKQNIFLCENGQMITYDGHKMYFNKKVKAGSTYIDKTGKQEIEEKFIWEKKKILLNGIAIIELTKRKMVLKSVVQKYDRKKIEKELFDTVLKEHQKMKRSEIYKKTGDFLYSKFKKRPSIEIL